MQSRGPVVPRREGTEKWLYEVLRGLVLRTGKAESGLQAVVRGEVPDGSGMPIVDLSGYFYLPGRAGGQKAHGGARTDENLTLSSTFSSDKGFIYLGSAAGSAFDEDNSFFGIGTATPAVKIQANTPAAGTTTIGATGTGMFRGSYAGTTLFDILPYQFNGGVYDTAIKPNNGGVQVISTDGTAGLRFAPTANRAFIQTGTLTAGGVVENDFMTIGALGGTYGTNLALAFEQIYFDGGTTTATKFGFGVGATPSFLKADPAAFGANWKGVALGIGKSTTEPALTVVNFSETTGAPGFEYRTSLTGSSPTQAFGTRLFSLEYDATAGQGRVTLWGIDTVRAGYLMPVPGVVSGTKIAIFDRNDTRALAVDSFGSMWADTRTAFFLELGSTVASFKAATLCGVNDSALDRFHVIALNTLWSDAALSGSTVVPGALLHLRNTASASKVVERIQPHASQSVDIWQVRNAADNASFVSISSSGELIATAGVSLTDTTFQLNVTDPTSTYWFQVNDLTTTGSLGFILDAAIPVGFQDLIFPSAGGTVITSTATQSIFNKTIGATSRMRCGSSAADTNGMLFQRGTSTTVGLRLNQSAVASAIRDWGVQNLSGTVLIVGDDPPAVASGSLGKVDSTGLTLAVGSTNLSNTPPAGIYRVYSVLTVTTAGGADRTIDVQIAWTDSRGAQTRNLAAVLAGNATNSVEFDYTLYVASGNLAYSTIVAGVVGAAPTYELRIRVVALG